MNLLESIKPGMTGEVTIVVGPDQTVGHFVPGMPMVYATPMMILLMEQASGEAITSRIPEGYVSVGIEVNVRHLAATLVGCTVRAVARVTEVRGRSIAFDVEAWEGDRKIGDGTHRRGVVNVAEFQKRLTGS